MTLRPGFDAFAAAWARGENGLVWTRLVADLDTPVSLMLKLTEARRDSFLLESVTGGEVRGRYSIMGMKPDLAWECRGTRVRVNRAARHDPEGWQDAGADPLASLRALIAESRIRLPPDLPPMAAGLFGYLGYDTVRLVERLPAPNPDPLGLPDALFLRPTVVLVIDGVKGEVTVVSPAWQGAGLPARPAFDLAAERVMDAVRDLDRSPARHSVEVHGAADDLHGTAGELHGAAAGELHGAAGELHGAAGELHGAAGELHGAAGGGDSAADEGDSAAGEGGAAGGGDGPAPVSKTPRAAYLATVERARDYIRAGDIFQVVPSQRWTLPFDLPPFALYRALRRTNPSPYMFYFDFGGFQLVGASPEILVRVRDGRVTIRPIAGTRPRGATPEADAALEAELLADPKERAEHLMLLDLGRNDVGRVARVGTVTPTETFVIERYSHVMHIVSNVEGELAPEHDALSALLAGLPAGTVSGAPKVRAMEIIDELEPEKRGVYGGGVGYFSAAGDMDVCIALRTAVVRDGTLYVQAGGGVVADSDPEAEYQETVNKARALFQAARDARLFAGR